jgi:hypothetical protein
MCLVWLFFPVLHVLRLSSGHRRWASRPCGPSIRTHTLYYLWLHGTYELSFFVEMCFLPWHLTPMSGNRISIRGRNRNDAQYWHVRSGEVVFYAIMLLMGGAIYSRNGNVDYTCRPLDCILTRKLKGIYCLFLLVASLMLTALCNANDSMDATDRPILCCPVPMVLCNANDSMGVGFKPVGECTCRHKWNWILYVPTRLRNVVQV